MMGMSEDQKLSGDTKQKYRPVVQPQNSNFYTSTQ